MSQTFDTISISDFKATCLAVLERIRRTGRPVLVTKRGVPIAEILPPSQRITGQDWIGALRDSVTVTGDIVAPVSDEDDWESLKK
jgi:prevent-host-death family protein